MIAPPVATPFTEAMPGPRGWSIGVIYRPHSPPVNRDACNRPSILPMTPPGLLSMHQAMTMRIKRRRSASSITAIPFS